MVRRYHDPVEVQSRAGATRIGSTTRAVGPHGGAAPTAFVWRGRLYVVREVLDHWRERRAWWREPPGEARPGAVGDGRPGGEDDVPGVPGPDDLEQEMWRVVASAGRHRGSGVYDLAGGDHDRAWRLVRVAD